VDTYFILGMLRNIITTFFREGIWVVGFFFLLHKTYESERLKQFSKYVIIVVLALILISSASFSF
jgi:hypothetical protein